MPGADQGLVGMKECAQHLKTKCPQLQHGRGRPSIPTSIPLAVPSSVCLCSCYFPSLSKTCISLKVQLPFLECWAQGLGLSPSMPFSKRLLFQILC